MRAKFTSAFADDLIELEFGPLPTTTRVEAREWVLARIGGSGEITRFGVDLAALAVGVVVRARTGTHYCKLSPERRRPFAVRLATTRLPVISVYVRAVRSLAVAYVYEHR